MHELRLFELFVISSVIGTFVYSWISVMPSHEEMIEHLDIPAQGDRIVIPRATVHK